MPFGAAAAAIGAGVSAAAGAVGTAAAAVGAGLASAAGAVGAAAGGLSAAGAIGLAGSAISAGTAIANAVGGSGKASSQVSSGQEGAIAAQQGSYDEFASNEQPFLTTGSDAQYQIANINGLNGPDAQKAALASFTASPGYQYQLQQGLSAVDNGAASVGTLRSGDTIRAEQTLGSNLANQDFTAYYNRLAGVAATGQTATAALGQAGVAVGAGQASTDTSAAAAQAGITAGKTQAVTNATNTLLNNPNLQNALANLGKPKAGFDNAVNQNDTSDGTGGFADTATYTP